MTSAGAIIAEQGTSPTIPAVGGTFVEGVAGSFEHLDPILAATDVDRDVAALAFTGLMRTDRSGEIVPDLAVRVDVSGDGRVWTFEIREDARWHDGQPVVADDVVYTVGLFQDPAYAGPYAEAFRGVAVERVAPRTVRFTLPGPYGPFAASMTFPLLPAHRLGGVPYARLVSDPYDRHPIGTGPFAVVSATPTEVTLAANTAFYRTRPARSRPYLDRVVLRTYPDASTALAALARGELDGVAGISSADAERARSVSTVVVYSYPTNDVTALFLNVRPGRGVPLDRAVRQAMSLAIDRGRVLDVAVDGRGQVADTMVPRTSWAYPADLERVRRSIPDAEAALAGGGWTDADGDGIRDKDGVPLRFTLSTSDEPARVGAARQIAADLEEVGIAVDVRTVPFDRLVDDVVRPRDFDLLLIGITGTLDPDPYPFFHSSQSTDPGYNLSGYSTLPLDRALEAARRTADRAQREALYTQVFQTISTEVPVISLYFADQLYAEHVSVKGSKVAQIVDPSQRLWDVEDWYVRTAPRR